MSTDADKLAALKSHWPEAELVPADGRTYVHLPNLKVTAGASPKTVAALLRPWANGDGYSTRLFFSEKFTTKGNNWNVFTIAGRTWHACSWNGVPETLPWLQMTANHLAPLL
ncbi:MAG: hypothetical protein IAE77_28785 [Prosthecobacter sp.]|jgi:hypothetical protein|uniref:hypothetical protein n=1 Tax=Prosthecobacter sp. TaxID=1965333 RepID=UPI001A0F3BF0|nr:hypothetical protein [Prosthecobacter sp.]MBE2287486.1 hypothetical protein [Prosthecobacter sp.]